MEFMYLPDSVGYQVIRSAIQDSYLYRSCEQAWSSKTTGNQPPASSNKAGTRSCPLCKEQKRRSLAKYIRSMSQKDSKSEHFIEEEEELEEDEQQPKVEKDVTSANIKNSK